jgi:hypothetical protein
MHTCNDALDHGLMELQFLCFPGDLRGPHAFRRHSFEVKADKNVEFSLPHASPTADQ